MPPKKKAKTVEKPSPAYLAELKKLGRVERKYVLGVQETAEFKLYPDCLLYTSPSPRDATLSRMPSSA